MVSPTPPTVREDRLQRDLDHPYVENYFPRQLSWYAPEGPQGPREALSLWVRENPWAALGIAVVTGAALAFLMGPVARVGAAGTQAFCRRPE